MMLPWKKKKLLRQLAENFGKVPDKDYYPGDMDRIRSYYDACRGSGKDPFYVDDTTWNDLDMDKVYMGEIATKYAGQGVRYRGTNSDGVALVSYSGKFLNDNRQLEAHVPAGCIIVGSRSNKPLKFKHGPIQKTTGLDETAAWHTYIKKEVPFRIGGSQSDSIATRLVSRPTIVPENVGAWAIMQVL